MNEQITVIDITLDNFNQIVIEGSFNKPVLIDFWATWCEHCKTLTPLLEQIVASYGGQLILAKVDCDQQQQIVAQFGVRSLPTVVLFKEGQAIDGFSGSTTEANIRKMLEKYVEAPATPEGDLLEQAKTLYDQGDKIQAEALLKELLAQNNNNMLALILYARCLAERGELTEAETILNAVIDDDYKQELVAAKAQLAFLKQAVDLPSVEELQATVQEQPSSDELCYQLAIAQLAQQQYEQAMEGLLTLFKRNRTYQEDLPRKTLIQLFDLLGNDNLLVINYRKKLYQALY
ncbi:co-chaperone YbbN [Entomomonas sp. E2T0]|uniref:thioredoxin family protein n=1 Tax=Entomomonas sp. E2T0 TaxID=2930213 RepID=UPI0022283744|nr:co-chaperone YbbN [Entomomonas sp. E2T0]UYZ84981.1 co-chaperone YbbN [Entomomonas sp. E2T0]